MNKQINKQKGIAQIVVMGIMLFLAIALPVTTNLVKKNQENRSKAAGMASGAGGGSWGGGSIANGQPCGSNESCASGFCFDLGNAITSMGTCESKVGSASGGSCVSKDGSCVTSGPGMTTGISCKTNSNVSGKTTGDSGCAVGQVCCVPDSGSAQTKKSWPIWTSSGGCYTSSNKYATLADCQNDPPKGNCFNSIPECQAAHPPVSAGTSGAGTKYRLNKVNGNCDGGDASSQGWLECKDSEWYDKNCFDSLDQCRSEFQCNPFERGVSDPTSISHTRCDGSNLQKCDWVKTDGGYYGWVTQKTCNANQHCDEVSKTCVDNPVIVVPPAPVTSAPVSNGGNTSTLRYFTVYTTILGCHTSLLPYLSLSLCNIVPPFNNCYNDLSACRAAHPVVTPAPVVAAPTAIPPKWRLYKLVPNVRCHSTEGNLWYGVDCKDDAHYDKGCYDSEAACKDFFKCNPYPESGGTSRCSGSNYQQCGCVGGNCINPSNGHYDWQTVRVCETNSVCVNNANRCLEVQRCRNNILETFNGTSDNPSFAQTQNCSDSGSTCYEGGWGAARIVGCWKRYTIWNGSSCTLSPEGEKFFKKSECDSKYQCFDSEQACKAVHPDVVRKKLAVWDTTVGCRVTNGTYIDVADCDAQAKPKNGSEGPNVILCVDSVSDCQNFYKFGSSCTSKTNGKTGVCVPTLTGDDDWTRCNNGKTGAGAYYGYFLRADRCGISEDSWWWNSRCCLPLEKMPVWDGKECRLSTNIYLDGWNCQNYSYGPDKGLTCYETYQMDKCQKEHSTPTCTYTYAPNWTACTASGVQTKPVVGQVPAVCNGTPQVPTQSCTPVQTCTSGNKSCLSSDQAKTCVNSAWVVTDCNSNQLCVDGVCTTDTTDTAIVNIKMAFAGVKNGKCAKDWRVSLKIANEDGENALESSDFSGVAEKGTTTNSNGDLVYNISGTITGVPSEGASGLSFFITGPKHLSIKYGEDGQTAWYNTFVGKLSLKTGTNNYDFSNYALLAGDVTGDTDGVPDGKIDGRDYSFIKSKVNNSVVAPDGTDIIGDIDGNCQVNANDVDLVKKSLIEINSQLY